VLKEFGAVSEPCVQQMAEKVRNLFNADYGLASSGIAGPSGGTDEKPVGTIWIACASKKQTVTKKLQLTQDRTLNIQLTGVALLNLLRTSISTITE
jgi:nicotinamide-nucleotide amidase